MVIRHVVEEDLNKILELNNSEAKWVGLIEKNFLQNFLNIRHFYIEENSKMRGFLMAMKPMDDYWSKNFLWFRDRYNDFVYIDRIIVNPVYRRKGIGSKLYQHLVVVGNSPLVCEVAIKPFNEESILFHEKLGFKSVGEFSANGKKLNRMYKLD